MEIPYTVVKEAVFPFSKFSGVDILLGPEMRSTGEVMGIDNSRGLAYLKSQLAAGNKLPENGSIFMSLKDADKAIGAVYAKELADAGFTVYATLGTSTMLYNSGIHTKAVFRISQGRPNLIDLLDDKKIDWIITTNEDGEEAMYDGVMMRSQSVTRGIPISTTLSGMNSAVEGIKEKLRFGKLEVCSIQEYHRHLKK